MSISVEIQNLLQQMAGDKQSGATALAHRGLDAIEMLAGNVPSDDELAYQEVVYLARLLCNTRPAIGAIGVQAVLAVSRARALVGEGSTWARALRMAAKKERELLGQSGATIASAVVQHLSFGGVFVTCSWSSVVMGALVALKPKLIRIGEGHRLGDGVRAARWLAARGIRVEILPDAALPTVVNGADAVIVGADQILADGSVVNRCSTFSIALAASYYGVPFYVLSQRIKFSGRVRFVPENSGKALFHLPPAEATVFAPLFDVTPPGLIASVITENGNITPAEAGHVGVSIHNLGLNLLGAEI